MEKNNHLLGREPSAGEANWPVLICLLGSFRVLKGGRPVAVRTGGKTESLLSSLSVRKGYRASRATLLGTLWPDSEDVLASQCLSSVIYSLHRLLGDAIKGAAPVIHAGGYYRLNIEAGVGVDVACFESLAMTGEQYAQSGNLAAAATAYHQATYLYHGDLCNGIDVHAIVERERVRTLYLTLLTRLADYHYSKCDYGACLKAALQLLTNDPCREDAHRMVMRCHVRRGERAQALRQYRLCEAVLRAEFEATPEPITTSLFDQVRLDPGSI